jgi:hypothetical protein
VARSDSRSKLTALCIVRSVLNSHKIAQRVWTGTDFRTVLPAIARSDPLDSPKNNMLDSNVHSIPDDTSSAASTTFAPSIHTSTEPLLQTNGLELLMRTFDSRTVTFESEIRTWFIVVEPVITSGPLRVIELFVLLHSLSSRKSISFRAVARVHTEDSSPDSDP